MDFRELISLVSVFVLPLLIVGIPLYGLFKRVPVYESFVDGAKEGFSLAVTIIPYLVAILFAIGMFRASGALDFLVTALTPVLAVIGVGVEGNIAHDADVRGGIFNGAHGGAHQIVRVKGF